MPPSKLAQLGFYTASFLNAVSVAGHTQVGFDVVFPSLRDKLILNEDGAIFAKIGWLEGNIVFGILAILCAKWAKTGLTDKYEKTVLASTAVYQILCGIAFARSGIYPPTISLIGIPALTISSYLL